ncbi:hypothetical protein R1flu_020288 [Riccia fluitans]|uniref:Membrane protein YjcL n=1 Tax=Riccia fluitans TaxID=41844 RepID=A0ABD1ZMK0_9MARC
MSMAGTSAGYGTIVAIGRGDGGLRFSRSLSSAVHLQGNGVRIPFPHTRANEKKDEKNWRLKKRSFPAHLGKLRDADGGRCSGTASGARALAGGSGAPLIAAGDTWGTWTVLACAGAFGLWSENNTKWGSTLSGALVSTLVGLAASNLGLIATSAPAYTIVNSYLLPLAVPLLLYGADLRRVIKDTGRLLIAFLLGSVATIAGTWVALLVVPLKMSLGADGWKIAAALMSRHIGGAVNYVAVNEALGTSPSIVAAGLAADNLICAIYFTTLFALATNIPPDHAEHGTQEEVSGFGGKGIKVEEMSIALAFSVAICMAGNLMAKALKLQGGGIPCITAVVVVLATLFPSFCGKLSTSGTGLAMVLLHIFFTTVGANASIANVIRSAPSLFVFSLVQVAVHLAMILGIGKLCGFQRKELLLASNANVGGPTTAAGMATAKGWRTLSVPSILIGIFGISIATFISIILGVSWLSKI